MADHPTRNIWELIDEVRTDKLGGPPDQETESKSAHEAKVPPEDHNKTGGIGSQPKTVQKDSPKSGQSITNKYGKKIQRKPCTPSKTPTKCKTWSTKITKPLMIPNLSSLRNKLKFGPKHISSDRSGKEEKFSVTSEKRNRSPSKIERHTVTSNIVSKILLKPSKDTDSEIKETCKTGKLIVEESPRKPKKKCIVSASNTSLKEVTYGHSKENRTSETIARLSRPKSPSASRNLFEAKLASSPKSLKPSLNEDNTPKCTVNDEQHSDIVPDSRLELSLDNFPSATQKVDIPKKEQPFKKTPDIKERLEYILKKKNTNEKSICEDVLVKKSNTEIDTVVHKKGVDKLDSETIFISSEDEDHDHTHRKSDTANMWSAVKPVKKDSFYSDNAYQEEDKNGNKDTPQPAKPEAVKQLDFLLESVIKSQILTPEKELEEPEKLTEDGPKGGNIFDKAMGFLPADTKSSSPKGSQGSMKIEATKNSLENIQPLDLSRASRTLKVPESFRKIALNESKSGDQPLDLSVRKRSFQDSDESPPCKRIISAGHGSTDCSLGGDILKPVLVPHRTSIFPKPAHTNSDSLRQVPGGRVGSPFANHPLRQGGALWNVVPPLPLAETDQVMNVRGKAFKVSPVRPQVNGKPVYTSQMSCTSGTRPLDSICMKQTNGDTVNNNSFVKETYFNPQPISVGTVHPQMWEDRKTYPSQHSNRSTSDITITTASPAGVPSGRNVSHDADLPLLTQRTHHIDMNPVQSGSLPLTTSAFYGAPQQALSTATMVNTLSPNLSQISPITHHPTLLNQLNSPNKGCPSQFAAVSPKECVVSPPSSVSPATSRALPVMVSIVPAGTRPFNVNTIQSLATVSPITAASTLQNSPANPCEANAPVLNIPKYTPPQPRRKRVKKSVQPLVIDIPGGKSSDGMCVGNPPLAPKKQTFVARKSTAAPSRYLQGVSMSLAPPIAPSIPPLSPTQISPIASQPLPSPPMPLLSPKTPIGLAPRYPFLKLGPKNQSSSFIPSVVEQIENSFQKDLSPPMLMKEKSPLKSRSETGKTHFMSDILKPSPKAKTDKSTYPKGLALLNPTLYGFSGHRASSSARSVERMTNMSRLKNAESLLLQKEKDIEGDSAPTNQNCAEMSVFMITQKADMTSLSKRGRYVANKSVKRKRFSKDQETGKRRRIKDIANTKYYQVTFLKQVEENPPKPTKKKPDEKDNVNQGSKQTLQEEFREFKQSKCKMPQKLLYKLKSLDRFVDKTKQTESKHDEGNCDTPDLMRQMPCNNDRENDTDIISEKCDTAPEDQIQPNKIEINEHRDSLSHSDTLDFSSESDGEKIHAHSKLSESMQRRGKKNFLHRNSQEQQILSETEQSETPKGQLKMHDTTESEPHVLPSDKSKSTLSVTSELTISSHLQPAETDTLQTDSSSSLKTVVSDISKIENSQPLQTAVSDKSQMTSSASMKTDVSEASNMTFSKTSKQNLSAESQLNVPELQLSQKAVSAHISPKKLSFSKLPLRKLMPKKIMRKKDQTLIPKMKLGPKKFWSQRAAKMGLNGLTSDSQSDSDETDSEHIDCNKSKSSKNSKRSEVDASQKSSVKGSKPSAKDSKVKRRKKRRSLLDELATSDGFIADRISSHFRKSTESTYSSISNVSHDAKSEDGETAEEKRKKKRKSILDELVSSDGFVAEKKFDKKNDNLWADPSKLTREERALQRAMMHFAQMESKAQNKAKGKDKKSNKAKTKKQESSARNKAKKLTQNAIKVSRTAFKGDSLSGKFPKKNKAYTNELIREERKLRAKLKKMGPRKVHDISPSASESESLAGSDHEDSDQDELMSSGNEMLGRMKKHGNYFRMLKKARNVVRGKNKKRAIVGKNSWKKIKKNQLKKKNKKDREAIEEEYDDECLSPDGTYTLPPPEVTSDDIDDPDGYFFDEDPKEFILKQEPIDQSELGGMYQLYVPPEVKKLSCNRDTGETILHRAARLNYQEEALWIARTKYVDIDARDHAGFTPLHEACAEGHYNVVNYLLENGANVNISSMDGLRPLHDAVENDEVEVARLLLCFGADPYLTTYKGDTVLSMVKSKEMDQFLQGYLNDLNGDKVNVDPSWQFAGSADFMDQEMFDPDEQVGFELLTVPASDDEDSDLLADLEFQFSDQPHLTSYWVCVEKNLGPKNYLLLSDVLNKLRISEDQLRKYHSDITVISVDSDVMRKEVEKSQISPPLPYHNNKERVKLVQLNDRINRLLGVSSVSWKSLREADDAGNVTAEGHDECDREVADLDSSGTISYSESGRECEAKDTIGCDDMAVLSTSDNTEFNTSNQSLLDASFNSHEISVSTPEENAAQPTVGCFGLDESPPRASGEGWKFHALKGSRTMKCQTVASKQDCPKEGTTPEQCLSFGVQTPFASPEMSPYISNQDRMISQTLLSPKDSPCKLRIVKVRTLDSPSSHSAFAPNYSSSPQRHFTPLSPAATTDGE